MTADAVEVWGLPLAPWTRQQAADAVMERVRARRPTYFITANTHYAMLTHQEPRLREVNERAAFLLADGAPLVLASRRSGTPLPERVAGSDLIYDIAGGAARGGHSLFLLGGPPGIAQAAADRLRALFPALAIAGTACPDADQLRGPGLIDAIREARPDILMVALGQPKGEFWIADHHELLGVPVSVQVGATLEFVAGRVSRAPRWIQAIHMEWGYRLALEPARLGPRYARNALFLARMIARDAAGRPPRPAAT
ncbi:MAG: WecB/TagA/CpsF family glycosyltransferase [Isosphaeraceae bacterium]